MKKSICLYAFLLVYFGSASAGTWKTNATVIIDDSQIPSKPASDADRAKILLEELKQGRDSYDVSSDLQEFKDFLKSKNLEKDFQKPLKSIFPTGKADSYPSFMAIGDFFRDKFYGHLTREEFEKLINEYAKLIPKQRNHFSPAAIKNFEDSIKEYKAIHQSLRQKTVTTIKSQCSSVDWSKKLPPRHSQTGTGWCYAFTVSDVLTALTGQTASAADLAYLHKNFYQEIQFERRNKSAELYGEDPLKDPEDIAIDPITEGGDVRDTFKSALEHGICLEKDFPSEALNQNKEAANMASVLRWMRKLGKQNLKGALSASEIHQQFESLGFNNIFPNTDLEASLSKMTTKRDLVTIMAASTCEASRQPINLSVRLRSEWLRPYGFQMLIPGLDLGPFILSVNDVGLFSAKKEWGRHKRTNHAVTVIARRWNEESGHCELKVRNSQTIPEQDSEQEWFSEMELFRNADLIHFLEKK